MEFLLLLLVSVVSLGQCSVNNTICVKSKTATLKEGASIVLCTQICSSINECNFSSPLSTVIVLRSGDHELSTSIELQERSITKLLGSSLSTRIKCAPNTGLRFVNGIHLSISNLIIENCSIGYFTMHHTNVNSAVFISGFGSVEILNTTVRHSQGSAISLINLCGKALVDGSNFLNNHQATSNGEVSEVYIEYSNCESNTKDGIETLINNSSFIHHSHGNAHAMNSLIVGGLSVTFNGNASNISLIIKDSVFLGATGSGLAIHFLELSKHNFVNVSSTYFADNLNFGSGYAPCNHSVNFGIHGDFSSSGGGFNLLFDGNSSDNEVFIEKSTFVNNSATSGGGLFILHLNFSNRNRINIASSNFSNNGRCIFGPLLHIGGGISVRLANNSFSNKVSITKSRFTDNQAVHGAGMYIQLENSSKFNSISVETAMFKKNRSPQGTGGSTGGGIEAGYYFFANNAPTNNSISFDHCHFISNYAYFGGGILLFSSYAFRTDINNTFYLTNCLWKENMANYGAAVDLSSKHSVHNYPPQGISPLPKFINCTFIMNKVVSDEDKTGEALQSRLGKGTFISTAMSACFGGTTKFDHCTGSAIHMTSGFLIFKKHSNVTFSHNSGYLGGAIGLVGRSSILVEDYSKFSFVSNTAVLSGGAIAYFSTDRHSFASFSNCFIEYTGKTTEVHDRHINFTFEGNTAPSGNSIYATTVDHCTKQPSCTNYSFKLFNCIANFAFDESTGSASHQLATAGKKFKLSSNYTFPLLVIPGKTFELPIFLIDEFDHRVQSQYNLRLTNTNSAFIPPAYSVLLKTNKTRIYGDPGETAEVAVFHKDGLQETELIFNITFQNCPPGYVVGIKERYIPHNSCICSPHFYAGIRCNYSAFQALLSRGYWIGYTESNPSENNLISGYCPEGYCNQSSNNSYLLPSVASRVELDQYVCNEGRTGILCGRCHDNYSVFYHGWIMRCLKSEKCSYGPALYIVLELLPITIMFVIIIVFDVPFTSGAVNGFLLFSQVIDTLQVQANRFIWMPAPIYGINTASIRFIYRMFSLQFFTANDIHGLEFFSFCLWKGSSALDMLAIHYVTLLYSLLLVVFTVKVINTCNIRKYCCECCFKMRRKRTVRGSITHGLTTFLLLCYSRYAQVSLMILIPGTIYGKGRVIVRQVVFYDGEIDFLSSTHLVYAVPALIICVMLILLPLLLILYPAWYKIFSFLGIGESKFLGILCRVISIEKLKPILDSFQGSFKDRFRFFAGLYFFYRLFAVIAFAYTSTLKVFYIVVEVQLISMLTVHTLVQPYKKRWHNAIDAILLADLAVINALTAFNYQNSFSSYNTRTITISASIQAILIWLPGVYVFMYAIWHILTEMCGIRLKLKCTYCFNIMIQIQATLANCWKKKRNTNEYSDVELQTLYYSYEP